MRARPFGLASALLALVLVATAGGALAQTTTITGAVLPTSRSVQVGSPATAFATVINLGTETATNCGLALGTMINATFEYRTTDPVTNLPIEPPQQTANIAPGGSQSWVFGVTPNAPLAPTEVTIAMDCDNSDPAAVYPSVNTLLLSASNTPIPDMVALAATLANDGVVRAPGYHGTGVFSVATSNVGAAGTITALPQLMGNTGGASAFICETNPDGSCKPPGPAASVPDIPVGAGEARSFGIFVAGNGAAPFDPANTRANVRFQEAGVTRGATGVAYETQTQMGSNGGTLHFGDAVVGLGTNAAWAPVSIEVLPQAGPPQPLPAGFGGVDRTRGVTVSDATRLNAPLTMDLNYDPTALSGGIPFVVRYNTATGQYEPVTTFAHDTGNHTVSVDARNFSSFVTTVANAVLPASFTVTGFDPAIDSWNIQNFGSYFAPGGNCLGMSAYAVWFHTERPAQTLGTKYSTDGGTPISVAHLTATRAHLAQSQYWAIQQFRAMNLMTDQEIAARMKQALFLFDRPLILILGTNGSPRHATVLYGWDATGFLHYEVNTAPGGERSQKIPFDGTSFGAYSTFNDYTFLAFASLGRSEDFADLTTEAEGGFTSSANISLTSPTAAQQVNANQVDLIGTLTGPLATGRDIVAYVNGERIPVGDDISAFDRDIPVKFGANTLVLLAGDMSQQSAWFKNAATLVRTFEGTLAAALFRATLTWNKSGDVDLYVLEPGGQASWYGNDLTTNGLVLDFDNTSGFGPENVTLSGAGGIVVPGTYKVRVHYYSGTAPVSGTVQVLLNEGATNQVNKTYNWTINVAGNGSNHDPTDTGPDWVDIADANVQAGTVAP